MINSLNSRVPSTNRTYNYDPIGNRLTVTEGDINNPTTNSSSKIYTSNALNQYTQINTTLPTPPTTAQPTYDDDGNMLTDGTGKTYTWDCENRLIQITMLNESFIHNVYDSGGRRVGSLSTVEGTVRNKIYFYDRWNLVHKKITTDSHSEFIYYIWGLDIWGTLHAGGGIGGLLCNFNKESNGASEGFYFSYDFCGNVSGVFNSAKNIEAHYEYDTYGNVIAAIGQRAASNEWRFSTKAQDLISGYYYYGHRFFDGCNGRWLGRDPLDVWGGTNLYGFAMNSTIYVDVNGLFVRIIDGLDRGYSPLAKKTIDALEMRGEEYYRYLRELENFNDRLNEALNKLKKCCDKNQEKLKDIGICKALESPKELQIITSPPSVTDAWPYGLLCRDRLMMIGVLPRKAIFLSRCLMMEVFC